MDQPQDNDKRQDAALKRIMDATPNFGRIDLNAIRADPDAAAAVLRALKNSLNDIKRREETRNS